MSPHMATEDIQGLTKEELLKQLPTHVHGLPSGLPS